MLNMDYVHIDVKESLLTDNAFPKAAVSIAFCPAFLCKALHNLHLLSSFRPI